MSLAAQVTRVLQAAGIPIVGVSIGREEDRSSWRINYAPGATAQHRADGAALLTNFDPTSTAFRDVDLDAEARAVADAKPFKAMVIWCAQRFGITVAQARSELIGIYKGLP